jgi:hypothetical protein
MNNYILYFVAGNVPTNEEFSDAEKFMNKGPILEFVSLVDIDLNAEVRDNVGVAGKVPEAYLHFNQLNVTAPPPPAPAVVVKAKAEK